MDLTDEQIKAIVERHVKRREYDKNRYHEVLKKDPDFIAKNRERAKAHYQQNGEKKRQVYAKNKELLSARSSARYYKKTDRLELFKEKHPEKYQLLLDASDPVLS